MPRTLFKTNPPPPISKNQELCPKSYRRSSAIFCEMGNTLSLQRNKKFLLTFKRYIRKRRVQHNLMRNFRPSKSSLITGTSLHKSLCYALDHPRRFLVTWSGNDHETTHETKRNETTGRLRIKPSGSGDENGRGRRG